MLKKFRINYFSAEKSGEADFGVIDEDMMK